MSRTLLEMRGDVRLLVDDQDGTGTDGRWTNAQVDTSVFRAQTAVAQILAQAGMSDVITNTTVSLDGAGVATVPENDGIHGIYFVLGNGTLSRIMPGNGANRTLTGTPSTGSILVEYYAKTVAAEGDGYTVEYAGVDINDAVVDQLTAYLAADDLKSVEGEPNAQVARKIPALEAQVRAKYSPGISVSPATNRAVGPYFSSFYFSRWFRSSQTTVTIYR